MTSKISGDDNFDTVKVGVTELWSGNQSSGSLTFSESILNFDLVLIEGYFADNLSVVSASYTPSSVIGGRANVFGYSEGGSGNSAILLALDNITATSATVYLGATTFTGSIKKVFGLNYGRT